MEEFVITVSVIALLVLIAAPIATLILVISVRGRIKRQQGEIESLRETLKREIPRLHERFAAFASTSGPAKEDARPEAEPEAEPATAAEPPPEPVPPPIPAPPVQATPEPAPPVPQPVSALPPPEPRAPRKPNAFEAAARRALTGIWNWVIVGEEYRKEGVTIEFAVATNWLLRIGVVVMLFGVGFFLRYAAERGLLGPQARVSLTLLAGAGMLAGGMRLLGGRYHLLAQGLMGAGLATLYFGVFAASSRFNLISFNLAFVGMAVITAGAGFMSVRFNSLLMAILGIVGGYGTPIMLSTGQANFIGLYTYMLLLGIGVLGIAHRRNWHLLNFLAFLATAALVTASLDRYYTAADFWKVMPFLIAFFMLFSTVVFIYHLAHGRRATLLELVMLVLNAAAFFCAAYALIENAYGQEWVAAAALGLALFYTAHVYGFLQRKLRDRGLIVCFLSLSSFFLAITMPLILSEAWITVSWGLQAFIMLWMASRLESRFLRQIAYLLYLVMFGRFFFVDLHNQFGAPLPDTFTVGDYLKQLLERIMTSGVPIASVAAAFRLMRHPVSAGTLKVDAESDTREWVRPHWALVVVAVVCFAMLFLYLNLEVNRTVGFMYAPFRVPALSILWVAACLLLLQVYLAVGAALLVSLVVFVVALVVKLFVYDLASWNASLEAFQYMTRDGYSFLEATMRLVDFGAVLAFFVFGYRVLQGRGSQRAMALTFGYGSLALLFLYATLELNSFLAHFVPGLRSGGISVFWSVFALSIVVAGILKHVRPLRLTGLILFAVVAFKVFSIDLDNLDPIYRIVAFILLGAVLLAGSFVYLRFRDRFATDTGEESPNQEQ